ncbi:MAG TPA: hypothetical protein VFO38_01480 [Candidatus Saccharimonadales bacterium]|nr:hypothetical protein [Candidatus Saccharimonadales bacterium]
MEQVLAHARAKRLGGGVAAAFQAFGDLAQVAAASIEAICRLVESSSMLNNRDVALSLLQLSRKKNTASFAALVDDCRTHCDPKSLVMAENFVANQRTVRHPAGNKSLPDLEAALKFLVALAMAGCKPITADAFLYCCKQLINQGVAFNDHAAFVPAIGHNLHGFRRAASGHVVEWRV